MERQNRRQPAAPVPPVPQEQWNFPNVEIPKIRIHPISHYNNMFAELTNILQTPNLWNDNENNNIGVTNKPFDQNNINLILTLISRFLDAATNLSSKPIFQKMFNDVMNKYGGVSILLYLHKLLIYHIAILKNQDPVEFLNHIGFGLSMRVNFPEIHTFNEFSNGKLKTSYNITHILDRDFARLRKLWTEYVWTLGKQPTLTQMTNEESARQHLVKLPGKDYYNMLFDDLLLAKLTQNRQVFNRNLTTTIRIAQKNINNIVVNPPNILQLTPLQPVITHKIMKNYTIASPDNIINVFLYLLFPELGKYIENQKKYRAETPWLTSFNNVTSEIVKNRYNYRSRDIGETMLKSSFCYDVLSLNRNNVITIMKKLGMPFPDAFKNAMVSLGYLAPINPYLLRDVFEKGLDGNQGKDIYKSFVPNYSNIHNTEAVEEFFNRKREREDEDNEDEDNDGRQVRRRIEDEDDE